MHYCLRIRSYICVYEIMNMYVATWLHYKFYKSTCMHAVILNNIVFENRMFLHSNSLHELYKQMDHTKLRSLFTIIIQRLQFYFYSWKLRTNEPYF